MARETFEFGIAGLEPAELSLEDGAEAAPLLGRAEPLSIVIAPEQKWQDFQLAEFALAHDVAAGTAAISPGTELAHFPPSPGDFDPQAATTLIASPVSDTVTNAEGTRLYAALTGGGVAVYDTASGTLLQTIPVGSFLAGIDISPDGSYLLVVEDNITPSGGVTGIIHKVDIATGTVTDYSLAFFGIEGPFHDVAIFDNGLAIATTKIRGSGATTTYQLNTETGVFSFLAGTSAQAPIVMASADRRSVALAQGFNVSGPNQIYGLAGNGSIALQTTISPPSSGQSIAAYSADGSLFATHSNFGGLAVYSRAGTLLASLGAASGAAFDTVGDHLYVIDGTNIRKFSTVTWTVVDTISTAGVSVTFGTGYGSGEILTVGPDSAYLLYNNGSTVYRIDNPGAIAPVEGTSADETMNGTAAADVLRGNDGNDTINGNDGNDVLRGGNGDDVLDGGTGHDAMSGGAGNDTYYVDDLRDMAIENDNVSGTDSVFASVSFALGPNIENLTLTGTGNIDGTGNSVNNVITGTSGNNVLNGMGGADTMTGGLGDDTYWIDNAGDVANENSGEGTDTIRTTLAAFTLGANFENLAFGGTGSFTGIGNDLANSISGGTGADSLSGLAGNDTIFATANDTLIDGGADIDTVVYSASGFANGTFANLEAMQINGAAAVNMLAAKFKAGFAANSVISGTGSLVIFMSTETSLQLQQLQKGVGSTVTLTINAGNNTNTVKAPGQIALTYNGGTLNDQVRGSQLADTINGGAGNDKIIGSGGADILTGGAGADQFRYLFASDSGLGAAADRITDFAIAEDRLNFALIDADAATPGDQAFSFIATAAFTNTGIGQIRYQNTGSDLLVQIDTDGNGTADMEVILQGLNGQTLTGANFLL